jgi:hypothetical protein
MTVMIMMMVTVTQYSKFQFKTCFNKVIGYPKKSTSLNTRLAAKTHLAVGEFLMMIMMMMMMIIVIIRLINLEP